jgi:hypothetical protein
MENPDTGRHFITDKPSTSELAIMHKARTLPKKMTGEREWFSYDLQLAAVGAALAQGRA